jgi:6-phosphogluconolactonase
MSKSIEVLPDLTSLIDRALSLVLARIKAAIADHGYCAIALAGGSTPKPLYEAIAQQDLPWQQIHVFWGDERYVAPDHADSNQRMARLAWLDRVSFPPANIHPMPTGSHDPVKDAQIHDQELQGFFQLSVGQFPSFDLILLGMGDDAHTASLFPQTPALEVCDRLVTVGNKDGQPRLTLTIPVINQAAQVLFLVAGASKKPALAQVFAPVADPKIYPSRFIQPVGELWWLLDQAAGEDLPS